MKKLSTLLGLFLLTNHAVLQATTLEKKKIKPIAIYKIKEAWIAGLEDFDVYQQISFMVNSMLPDKKSLIEKKAQQMDRLTSTDIINKGTLSVYKNKKNPLTLHFVFTSTTGRTVKKNTQPGDFRFKKSGRQCKVNCRMYDSGLNTEFDRLVITFKRKEDVNDLEQILKKVENL